MLRGGRRAVVLSATATILALLVGAPLASAAGEKGQTAKLQVQSDLTTKNVSTEESRLACLIADAVREAGGTEIAFLAASAFNETTIPKGTASVEDVLKALAFRTDSISVVKLKGSQIRQALERAVELYPQRRTAFLQVSGISVDIDPNADPGKRITAVKVGRSDLAAAKVYAVAMPAPLADGALTYYKVWSKSDIDRDHDPNVTLEEAVTRYLSGRKSIGEKGEERLVFKK